MNISPRDRKCSAVVEIRTHCVSGQNLTRIQLSCTRYATLVGAISSSEGRGRSKTTFFVLPIVDLVRKHKNSKQKLKIENIGFKV